MSSDLKIHFEYDLPAMAVEVVAPDFQVVERIMLSGGETVTVPVPSEKSYLRLLHPTGRTITLTDPGNLDRTITADLIGGGKGKKFKEDLELLAGVFEDMQPEAAQPALALSKGFPVGQDDQSEEESAMADVPLPVSGTLTVTLEGEESVHALGVEEKAFAEWQPLPIGPPGRLLISMSTGSNLSMLLPAGTRSCTVAVLQKHQYATPTVAVRLTTGNPVADTILNYLRQGDMVAAAVMEPWAKSSGSMLKSKMGDPYSAAVGAYLLLRKHRFDLLHDWPKNLADWFDYLPDGCVIWAWQLIQQEPSRRDEIAEYLHRAVERGLPVYTSGLRLLFDGLRLLGDDGKSALTGLMEQVNEVLWESPLTAQMDVRPDSTDSRRARFDIGFLTES